MKKAKKCFIALLIIIFSGLVVGAGAYFYGSYKLNKTKGQYSNKFMADPSVIQSKFKMNNESPDILNDINSLKEINFETIDGIENILLLGADFRKEDKNARSDCMIVLTIDTVNKKLKVTSLMRDVLVEIPGFGQGKLNHSFYLGGVSLLKDTIRHNFNIEIEKYLLVDFESFTEVVDVLGGIEVNVEDYEINELNKYIDDIKIDKSLHIKTSGKQVLNGRQALSYVRIRKNVGDEYGRNERQREVVMEVFNKAKEVSMFKYPKILNVVLDKIDTNIEMSEMISLAMATLKLDIGNTEMSYLPYSEISKGGIYQNYGWVFRTDLEKTANLFNKYIYFDEKPKFN